MQNMFIDPLKNLASYEKLLKNIDGRISPISTYGIIDENIGHIGYALNEHMDKQVLIITYDASKAKRIYEDIKNFNEDIVELFPAKEILFYKIDAISSENTNQRLKVLSRLIQGESIIVVAYIEGVLNKVISPKLFKEHITQVKLEDRIELDELAKNLISCGYERESMVEGVGQFSIRGGIIDFFAPDNENPYRIELFDDEVDSIRTFDIGTQRSVEIIESVFIPPVREVFILED